jgi:hypothetical protein
MNEHTRAEIYEHVSFQNDPGSGKSMKKLCIFKFLHIALLAVFTSWLVLGNQKQAGKKH